jgi:hypothetical protein
VINTTIQPNETLRYTVKGAKGQYVLTKQVWGEVKNLKLKTSTEGWMNGTFDIGTPVCYVPTLTSVIDTIIQDHGMHLPDAAGWAQVLEVEQKCLLLIEQLKKGLKG